MRLISSNAIHNLAGLEQRIRADYPDLSFAIGAKGGGKGFVEVADNTDTTVTGALQTMLDTFDETLDSNKTAEQLQREQVLTSLHAGVASAEGKLLADLSASERDALLDMIAFRLGAAGLDGRIKPAADWLG